MHAAILMMETFIVDPPTMLVAGTLIAWLLLLTRSGRALTQREFAKRRRWVDLALVVFFVGFWCAEGLSYFDVLPNPYDPSKTGNDFMWNGYVELLGWRPFSFDRPTYKEWWSLPWLVSMLALQWCCLRIGRRIGFALAYFGLFGAKDTWSKRQEKRQ